MLTLVGIVGFVLIGMVALQIHAISTPRRGTEE